MYRYAFSLQAAVLGFLVSVILAALILMALVHWELVGVSNGTATRAPASGTVTAGTPPKFRVDELSAGMWRILCLREQPVDDKDFEELCDRHSMEWFSTFHELDFRGGNLTSVSLERVAKFANITRLDVSETRVTSESLLHLTKLRKLQHLELEHTPIDDRGLEIISQIEALESLALTSTSITDLGINHILKLKKLDSLYLADTQITSEGLKKLDALRLTSLAMPSGKYAKRVGGKVAMPPREGDRDYVEY